MYCNPSDILSVVDPAKFETILGRVDDGVLRDDGKAINIDNKVLEPYIRRASTTMDAILGARYIIPVTGRQAQMMLVPICVNLAIAAMFKTATDYKAPEWVTDDVKSASALLAAYVHQGDPKTWLTLPAAMQSGARVGVPGSSGDALLKWRVGLNWPDQYPGANPSADSVQGFLGVILQML